MLLTSSAEVVDRARATTTTESGAQHSSEVVAPSASSTGAVEYGKMKMTSGDKAENDPAGVGKASGSPTSLLLKKFRVGSLVAKAAAKFKMASKVPPSYIHYILFVFPMM